jgi:hypothetical protein
MTELLGVCPSVVATSKSPSDDRRRMYGSLRGGEANSNSNKKQRCSNSNNNKKHA